MSEVLIRSTFPSLHHIGLPASRKVGAEIVPVPDLPDTGRITLLPGHNRVRASLWALALENKLVKHSLDAGKLEEVKSPDSKRPLTERLEALKGDEAIALVRETVEGDLLRTWDAVETRGAVRSALAAQLRKIDPTAKDAE